jgi:phosphate transport system ATP-binding protein
MAVAGAVTALIGPSGCGKSTFLRAINRMHEIIPGARVQGRLFIDEQDIYAKSMKIAVLRQLVGLIPQKPNPFPAMSIYDNVVAGLRHNGERRRSTLDDSCERALRQVNLWSEVKMRLNRPGSGLSVGQQQRLCIARALAMEPEVLLMDEPCSSLDPFSTQAIEDLIRDLVFDYTVVIVTNNPHQAARVSDRTAFFSIDKEDDPGRLVEFGDTSRIFTNPREKRTADFIAGRFG